MGAGSSTSPRIKLEELAESPTPTNEPSSSSAAVVPKLFDVIRKVSSASVSLVTSQKLTARESARDPTPVPTPRELRSTSYNKDQSKKKWTIGSLFVIEYTDSDEPEIDSAVLGVKRKENMSPYDAHHAITSMLGN